MRPSDHIVELGPRKRRGARANVSTAAVLPQARLDRLLPPHDRAFAQSWPALRTISARLERPGVAVAAVDNRGTVASACFAAHRERVSSVIIGRHQSADLSLDLDPTLSLRHLALVIAPLGDGQDVRYKLLDLRTGEGFSDETGGRVEAIESNGPTMLSCAGYRLVLVPTLGDGLASWPADGGDAWDALPERKVVPALPERKVVHALPAPAGPAEPEPTRRTPRAERPRRDWQIVHLDGPLWSGDAANSAPVSASPIVGSLEAPQTAGRRGAEAGSLLLTEQALSRGVVVGRYPRCASKGRLPLDATVSRVHALVLDVDGQPWLIDVASINGVELDGAPIRQAPLPLDRPAVVRLGRSLLRWQPAR
ncbi:MAG: hypothetical protein CSA66_05675 [Proteobacteria bacterium]|nr:MAG: hypothetical protein CSA66_05675 [Pseudomonadota bacterium]